MNCKQPSDVLRNSQRQTDVFFLPQLYEIVRSFRQQTALACEEAKEVRKSDVNTSAAISRHMSPRAQKKWEKRCFVSWLRHVLLTPVLRLRQDMNQDISSSSLIFCWSTMVNSNQNPNAYAGRCWKLERSRQTETYFLRSFPFVAGMRGNSLFFRHRQSARQLFFL